MKISVTPLSVILMAAICAGLIYSMTYVVKMLLGVSIPDIPDAYIESQVKRSFEASKFNARIEDPKIEKNLFNPERKTLKRIALVSMVSNAQFVLHGTFITPYLQTAYLEDIGNPPAAGSGERSQQVLQKGDMISGFVLTEIYPTSVLLVRNNEKILIQLSEYKPVHEKKETKPKYPQARPADKITEQPQKNESAPPREESE